MTQDNPFFIVGAGRSGTTLLRVILSAHSAIAIPPETYFIEPLLEALPIDAPLSDAEQNLAVEIMTSHYRWPDMNLTKTELQEQVKSLEAPQLKDITDIVYRHFLQVEGKTRWGDKTPRYIHIMQKLVLLYPGARFVYLVRDGRDVAKSFQTVGWYGPWLHCNTIEWKLAAEAYFRERSKDIPMLKVAYEDLVLDMEHTVRQVCEFIGVAFEPKMLRWEEQLDGKIPAREAHIHQKLSKSPTQTDVYRWKREMSVREVFIVESFIGATLQAVGYERFFKNAAWRPVFWLVRTSFKLGTPLADFSLRLWRFLNKRLMMKNVKVIPKEER